MIKRLLSIWKYVQAGNLIERREYDSAFQAMEAVKSLAQDHYRRPSVFEMNMRSALAAKMSGHPEIALDEIRQAREKLTNVNSISGNEKNYLTAYCNLFESECEGGDESTLVDGDYLRSLLDDNSIRSRYKLAYPIELSPSS